MVILLGACWLVQSVGRGAAVTFAARAWPWLLVPFAVFVAVASDPEVWILREISLAQALRDPQILEHQLGALMVLLLVLLGWRDRRRDPATRPLGVALPAIMIVGSLLLLGHAHSTLTVTEETQQPHQRSARDPRRSGAVCGRGALVSVARPVAGTARRAGSGPRW